MSSTPFLLKGALIYFGAPMLVPIPNIVVFQYNPESMTRSFTPWAAPARSVVAEYDKGGNLKNEGELKAYGETLAKLSQPYDPAETFTLALELDAADLMGESVPNPIASTVGVADRLAAIEMLLYPPGDSVTGGMLGSVGTSLASSDSGTMVSQVSGLQDQLSRRDAPIVLFFWGPGRIVPVRITSLTIEEQQYSALLYPTRAKATVGLRVLDLDDLTQLSGDPATGAAAKLAAACYSFTLAQKQALALVNLASDVASIVSALPI